MFDDARKTDPAVNRLTVAVSTRWYSQYTSMKSILDARYILTKICNEKVDELNDISDKAPAVIGKITSAPFWAKLAAVNKLIEYPVKIIGEI